jgi:hypothetical protein
MTYVDYIIFWGESTMDHRILIANLRSAYNIAFTNCKYWNGTTPFNNYTPGTDTIWGATGGYTYDTYLMKMISDTLGITGRYIKHAKGATTIGYTGADAFNSLDRHPAGSFNVNVYGSHYSALKSYILNVKAIHRMLGQQARFRLVVADLKGNDAFYDYSTNYARLENGLLVGDFVDFHNHLKVLTENPDLPIIHSQLLFKQTSLGTATQRNAMLLAQETFQTYYPNSYFLRMNEIDILDSTHYSMQPDQHLDDNGDYNKATDILNIITTNNLLADWQ